MTEHSILCYFFYIKNIPSSHNMESTWASLLGERMRKCDLCTHGMQLCL
jgi:hypothetical protein